MGTEKTTASKHSEMQILISPSPPQGSSAYFIFRGLHPKEDNLSAQDAYLPREELGMRFDHSLTRKCGATNGRCSRHYWKKHTHTHTHTPNTVHPFLFFPCFFLATNHKIVIIFESVE